MAWKTGERICVARHHSLRASHVHCSKATITVVCIRFAIYYSAKVWSKIDLLLARRVIRFITVTIVLCFSKLLANGSEFGQIWEPIQVGFICSSSEIENHQSDLFVFQTVWHGSFGKSDSEKLNDQRRIAPS
jgi:hypothetical protein